MAHTITKGNSRRRIMVGKGGTVDGRYDSSKENKRGIDKGQKAKKGHWPIVTSPL